MKPTNNSDSGKSPREKTQNRIDARLVLACIILFALLIVALPGMRTLVTAAVQPQKEDGLSDSAARQIQALLSEKDSRSPAQQKLDSQLLYAVKIAHRDSLTSAVPSLETGVVVDNRGKTIVDIAANVGGSLIEDLYAADADVLNVYAQYNMLRAAVPLDQLEKVAGFPQVIFIMPKQEGNVWRSTEPGAALSAPASGRGLSPNFPERAARVRTKLLDILPKLARQQIVPTVGSQNSQGDTTHKANLARSTFGANGAGIRIGVLSNGVVSLAASQALGDLGPVTVLPGQTGTGDEGTAMLEIVHDLAPGAQLFFATANPTIAAFAQNIRDLRTAGCDIIVDDVFYFVESPFQDGQAPSVVSNTNGGLVIQAVKDVTAAGCLYFSSAGNQGNKNDNTSSCYQGDFLSGGTIGVVPGGTVHDFGGGAQSDLIQTGSGNPINLYWADPLGGATNDYDLFVLNNALTTVIASSTNVQNGTQDPFEQTAAGNTTNNRVVVLKKTVAANRFFHITINANGVGRLGTSTEGTTKGHSMPADAYSVAATPAAPPGPFPNPHSAANVTETFTSDGPRRIFFTENGTAITPGNFSSTGGTLRQKPDITAADRVSVTGVGGFPTTFSGTSASAPHAAAIAGLLKSAFPTLTPAQVRTILTSTAIDIEIPGVDRDSGAGIIMPFEAELSNGAVASANFETGAITATEVGGNANTFIEPGESGSLSVQLTNTGNANAAAISATISTTTPGVTVTGGTSAYPNLAFPAGSGTNTTPFTFALSNTAPCDLKIDFKLTITYTGGNSPKVASFFVQTGRPPVSVTTTIDATAPPASTDYTAVTGTQINRVTRDGRASTCNLPKPVCPGVTTATNPRFDAYTFATCATGSASRCITVSLTTPCPSVVGGTQLFVTAYLGSFVPATICTNYLADSGSSPAANGTVSYTFTVAAGSTFVVVVSEVPGTATNCNYTLTVSGQCLACPAPCTLTCPANITQSTDPNQCSAVVTYPAPTTSGSCGAVTCSPASGSTFAKGVTTVTCSEPGGASCSFTVTVNDTQPPAITCPGNITQSTDANLCTAVVNFTTPTPTDNCPGATAVCAPASGSTFVKGTTTVTCTATDAASLTATCTFTVTVSDSQAPTITCPANITTSAGAGVCSAVVTYSAPTVSDNCPGVGTPTCTPASGSTFPKGTTTVSCSVTDASANTGTCTFTVTVNDTQPPTITCPANITTPAASGQCSASVSYAAPTVSDNCTGVGTPVCAPASGSSFPRGTTTVSCSVADASGNTANCTFTVTVNDTQPPTITCPANINTPGNAPVTVNYTTPTPGDNCAGATATCAPASGSTFPVGTTTVTCTATDTSANTATCMFTVTVTPCTITCPANITQSASAGQCSAAVTYSAPTTTGTCGAVTCSPASGSTFVVGTTTVTCTAAAGPSCTFTITVNDTQAPVITCPANIIQGNTAGLCSAVVTFATTATDNCSGVGTPACSPASGSTFPKGTTTVNCSVTDAAGNSASCSFTVTVNDTQPPTITCPANVTVSSASGQCSAVVTYSAPTVSDNCTGVGTPSCSPASGSTFPKGTTTVSCTVLDGSANSASCSFTVTVNDTQPPSISCPANITKPADPNQCSAVVTYAVTATDNCPGVTVAASPASGSTFPKGTTTVTATATDSSGNTASCSFTVTVADTQAPTIVCPANITAIPPVGSPCVNVSYPAPAVADNCPGATVVCSPASGSCFPIGQTTVTCTATDAGGNTATCSFVVTTFDLCVQDDSNPGAMVLVNTVSGDYQFCCGGNVFTGQGTVSTKGNLVTVEQSKANRRVTIKVDKGLKQGTASYASPPGTVLCQIRDTNTANNSCVCH